MSKVNNDLKEVKMNNKLTPIRHGEIILTPVSKAPKGKVEQHKKFIVGHSETGHHHILKSDVDFGVVFDKLEVYLLLNRKATLTHKKTIDKHRDIVVEPGVYKVGHKIEYNPFLQEIQKVID